MAQCTAKSKQSGQRCKRSATSGSTKCSIHGAKTPRGADSPNLKHGRYSPYLKQSLQDKLTNVQDDNPLDFLPELEVQRALFAEYISRFAEGMQLSAYDIDYLFGWSAEIGKSVERIVKMRNETAMTNAEVQFLAVRVVELVGKYIVNSDQQQAFISELFAGVPALSPGAMG